ncbi:MAG: hypothetical protein ACTSRC_21610 [Candidatus Helarchaeota archaeon]
MAAQIPSPAGWSLLPIVDSADDVYQYTGTTPCDGAKGAYHGEIDIKTVDANGANLVIEFKSTPIIGDNSYQATVYFDINGDQDTDYYIGLGYTSGNLFLKRLNDSTYWSGSEWASGMTYLNYTISVNNLTIEDIGSAIASFASAKFAVVWGYIGENPTLYADYTPNDPNCPIPSFSVALTIFSLLTIMGLIFLLRHERNSF